MKSWERFPTEFIISRYVKTKKKVVKMGRFVLPWLGVCEKRFFKSLKHSVGCRKVKAKKASIKTKQNIQRTSWGSAPPPRV